MPDNDTRSVEELEAQVSELQSATRNDATEIIRHHIPWRSNDAHPRRVVLAYIRRLEIELARRATEYKERCAVLERERDWLALNCAASVSLLLSNGIDNFTACERTTTDEWLAAAAHEAAEGKA